MTSAIQWIGLLIQAGILAVLVDIAWHMRQVNAKTGVSFFMGHGHKHFEHGKLFHHNKLLHHNKDESLGITICYSIWAYREGKWVLVKHCGQPGCECGPPPSEPGEYEGKVIRKECPKG